MDAIGLGSLLVIIILGSAFFLILLAIKVVPQSMVFVVERFGQYTTTLQPGLRFVVPFVYRVSHRVSILERQLKNYNIKVITKDNVEVALEATLFYRVVDASSSVYRIQDIDQALTTAAISIVRSEAGKLELDELLSSRENMNQVISASLIETAKVWGIDVTRSEIIDINVDEQTKEAQRQQLNAERERRATIAIAEGGKRSVELAADAKYYEAQRDADSIKVRADAYAYEVRARAAAEAEQTSVIAEAINNNGRTAVEFEILKRQVDAIGALASSRNSKTVVIPTSVTETLGSLAALVEVLPFGNADAKATQSPFARKSTPSQE